MRKERGGALAHGWVRSDAVVVDEKSGDRMMDLRKREGGGE